MKTLRETRIVDAPDLRVWYGAWSDGWSWVQIEDHFSLDDKIQFYREDDFWIKTTVGIKKNVGGVVEVERKTADLLELNGRIWDDLENGR